WGHRLFNRPIFTAGFFKPNIYNGPLPRFKPQPDHIFGMIHKRRTARNRRIERQRTLMYQLKDPQVEDQFESSLADFHATFQRDAARAMGPTPPDHLRQLRAARREKVANKTRERKREARGEVLSATRRRSRLGFPAHVLARWAPAVRRANLLARRSASEVGYWGG
ncbi:hypothetical protein BC826DRAFT_915617, partial [Russula brevipes]